MNIEHTNSVLNEVMVERSKQVTRFGTNLDDNHGPADWWTIVSLNFASAFPVWRRSESREYDRPKLRAGLIKVAAIVVAWIEAIDRN